MQIKFSEMRGRLALDELPPAVPGPPIVVLSSMSHGFAVTPKREQFALKYVAEGEEIYTYGGRSFAVKAGRFLVVPPGQEGDVELRRSCTDSNHGLCLTLPNLPLIDLDGPLLLAANSSVLGKRLAKAHSSLGRSHHRPRIAQHLMNDVSRDFEALLEESINHIAGLRQLRPAARNHVYARLCVARSYLHEIDDRAVGLGELAKHTGMSKFHLLRNFRDCFGMSPSAYQRQQRLRMAGEAIRSQRISNTEAAHRFGFSDGSSLSHAYKRVFRRSPRD